MLSPVCEHFLISRCSPAAALSNTNERQIINIIRSSNDRFQYAIIGMRLPIFNLHLQPKSTAREEKGKANKTTERSQARCMERVHVFMSAHYSLARTQVNGKYARARRRYFNRDPTEYQHGSPLRNDCHPLGSLLLPLPSNAIQTIDDIQHLCQTFRDYCVVRTQKLCNRKKS